MSIWLLLVSLLPNCRSHGAAQYECGPHGRFEYCIDGIPGCVVGCHCHPGYYFDTDTKICEPNMKLTQEYRRNYPLEPTRVQNLEYDQITSTVLTPTITNPVDAKIDEITKDADDLGDWLYSQFFKTIENQVINSTSDNQPTLTRRSGNGMKKKSKRRSRKRGKKTGKKSKHKRGGLKKKLLRITEDDSLFDSSSSSGSDEDTSSGSSDSDTDSSSDNEKSDKDHGHKKILIFNKKPKPPLPSFIFLPNMDTPFYPPIGLPPPPVIPMYPFVPVPPVAPMVPYPGLTTPCDESETSIAPTSTSTSSATTTTIITTGASTTGPTTTLATSASTLATPDAASTATPAPSETTTTKPTLRARDPSQFGRIMKNKNKHGQRNKLLQKLKEKIKRRNKFPHLNSFPDDYTDVEEPVMDGFPKADYSRQIQSNAIEEDIPMEDVDFKYLTQLIHRVDFNNTRKPPKYPIKQGMPPGGRRNYNEQPRYSPAPAQAYRIEEPRRPRIPNPDDTYYSNLGRQIATMIRKIDLGGNREVDIEIQKENAPTAIHPVFSDSHSSRSFWERSVRSPSKTFFQPRDSSFIYLKHSNENLFNLENKVEVAVTTHTPLSLREIENIINKIEQTQVVAQKKNHSVITTPSRKTLSSNMFIPSPKPIKNKFKVNNNSLGTIKYENASPSGNFYSFLVNNYQTPTHSTLAPIVQTNKQKLEFYNKAPTRKPQTLNEKALKVPMMGYIKFLSNPTTTKKPIMFQQYPVLYNRKKIKYHTNNNQYLYEKTSYPFYFTRILSKVNQPIAKSVKPSYFHHELHHFDYFDK